MLKPAVVACVFAGVGVADLVWLDGFVLPRVLDGTTAAPSGDVVAAAIVPELMATPVRVEPTVVPAPARPSIRDEPVARAEPERTRIPFPQVGRHELPPAADATIDAVVRRLQAEPELVVTVQGHADARGSTRVNMKLSERRARAVAGALTSRGIARDRISLQWFGERRPLARGTDSRAWAANRRAEIVWGRGE